MPRLCLSVKTRLVGGGVFGWLLGLLVALCPSIAASSQEKFYALLIGINDYPKGINALRYAVRDAEALHATLIRAHGLSPAQAKAQFRLLLDRKATKQAIKDSFRKWLRKRLTPADTVLIFFAGRGKDHDGLTYWITADATPKNPDNKGISHLELHSEILELNTKKVAIFVDAFHSQFNLRGRSNIGERILNHANFQGQDRVLLASARESQESGEDDSLQHGFFTYALLEALQGKADDNRDGKVDLFEAYVYLSRRVFELAKEKKNHTQIPALFSQISGPLVLATTLPPSVRAAPSVAPVAPTGTTSPPPTEGESRTFQAKGQTFALRYIPAGTFQMGSPENDPEAYSDEKPSRKVTLTRSFWMLQTEVTQEQFRSLMNYNPSSFSSCGSACPVESVNWHEAAAFANALSTEQRLPTCFTCTGEGKGVSCRASSHETYPACKGFRLPTEAEWEYAARAKTTTPRYGELSEVAWYTANSDSKTHPVGGRQANAWGLHEMLGNVYEWVYDTQRCRVGSSGERCGWPASKGFSFANAGSHARRDVFKKSSPTPQGSEPAKRKGQKSGFGSSCSRYRRAKPRNRAKKDPVGRSGRGDRVFRGGGWNSSPRGTRAADRNRAAPTDRRNYLGFRLLRSDLH